MTSGMRVLRLEEVAQQDAVWRLFGPKLHRPGIARLIADPTSHLLVAVSEEGDDELDDPGTPVGVLLGSEVTGADLSNEMLITYIAVRPLARRLGVGSALVRSMLAFARERGCTRAHGTIAPENTGAIHAMRSLGAATENVSINVSWQLTASDR